MTKARAIIISPLALRDIEDIWVHTLKTWSVAQANKYHDELYYGFNKIADGTANIKSINHIKKSYWQYKINHHYVIFKITQQQVNIIRVLHEKMDTYRHLK